MLFNPKIINSLKFLAIDAIENAKSGHPGMPLGMADIATVLWLNHMIYNAKEPDWINRDRFILSNGHGSMLQYALLYLLGYDLSIDEIKNFRQLNSKTPGHPEYKVTPGIETTTGPLGQGLANAVGMALAEKQLAYQFNKPSLPLIDHYIYCFVGDGCLMEGISHEVCSLAGSWKLNKLIVVYDSNDISIDGNVENWMIDDVKLRFESYNWQVIGPINGHDQLDIDNAFTVAKYSVENKPIIIIAKTKIGHGSLNKEGSASSHGAPLGSQEIKLMREKLRWDHPAFEIPEECLNFWRKNQQGKDNYQNWLDIKAEYYKQFPDKFEQLNRRLKSKLPVNFLAMFDLWAEQFSEEKAMATRKASQKILNLISTHLPELVGGSADLTESNLTKWNDAKALAKPDYIGNYINFGVREFGMAGILNGMALYKGFIVFGGTFLTFSDYCRNAIRMSALMNIPVIYIFTHDSIFLGEDGPTHQPIEHISSLRLIPNLELWRPADITETLYAWSQAISNKNPTAIILSRQVIEPIKTTTRAVQRGAYIIEDDPKAKIVIMASGSEVELAISVSQKLTKQNIFSRVVSIPSTSCFAKQSASYKAEILPFNLPLIVIEAGSSNYWYTFVKDNGLIIGIDRFGESGKTEDLKKYFNFTLEDICTKITNLINNE